MSFFDFFKQANINWDVATKSIFYCTKCKKLINTYSRKSRLCWLCAWREDKFIVIFFKYFTILQMLY